MKNKKVFSYELPSWYKRPDTKIGTIVLPEDEELGGIMNLVSEIKELKRRLQLLRNENLKKEEPLKTAIEALQKINNTCEYCEGKGKVLRGMSCAEDDRPDPNDPTDWRKCQSCLGTGKSENNE